MHPILFKLPVPGYGVVPIRSFGVMVALAFLFGYWFTKREARRTGRVDPLLIDDLFFWVFVGALLGARLLYVAVHWKDTFAKLPLADVFAIWKGGLVYYGGFLGAFFAGIVFTRVRNVSLLELGDVCLPGAMLGQAIGRIGCFLVGDDYGRPASPDLPWAVTFPDTPDSLLPAHLHGIPLHPTQLYLLLKAFAVFLILVWISRHKRFTGQVMFSALVFYPIGRFIVEFWRGDAVERGVFHGLSTSQWISIPLFLCGLIGLIAARARARSPAAGPS